MRTMLRPDRLTGVFFLLTFVSAIAGSALYAPVLSDPGYLDASGGGTRVALGAVCEIVLVVTNLGTAVVLFPVLRSTSECAALGYVTARIVECALIVVGMICVLSVVSLRQHPGTGEGAALGSYRTTAQALVELHDWTFLLGPGFVAGIGNGLLLGYLMARSGLMPRSLAMLGLLGGPLMASSGIAVLFGVYPQTSWWSGLATLPEIVWEASLGLYLAVHGFRRATAPLPSVQTEVVVC